MTTTSSDTVSVDMACNDDDAKKLTPEMKEVFDSGIFETSLYIKVIDRFARLAKPDLVAVFVKKHLRFIWK